MRLLRTTVVFAALVTAVAIHGVRAVGAPPVANQPDDGKAPINRTDAARARMERLRFAPMWIPVPRFLVDSTAASAPPSAVYAMIWEPEWQKELDLSEDQTKALMAIRGKAVADTQKHIEAFQKLSPEEQRVQAESWGGKSAPWRQQLDNDLREQIEAVLTPQQVQTLKEFTFPTQVVGLLYDADVRREIGFSEEQVARLRDVIRAKLARAQQELLTHAEAVWELLSQPQQAELADVVKQQGPTSAALSIAYDLGFDVDAMGLYYPMLAEAPVRERLALSAEQETQLQAVMADAAVRSRKLVQGALPGESQGDDRQRVEAILTPRQMTVLDEINFRRQVVLALGYPEKRKSIGITDQQRVELQQLDQETHQRLYRIDREMLGKVLQILTPGQREQLTAMRDR